MLSTASSMETPLLFDPSSPAYTSESTLTAETVREFAGLETCSGGWETVLADMPPLLRHSDAATPTTATAATVVADSSLVNDSASTRHSTHFSTAAALPASQNGARTATEGQEQQSHQRDDIDRASVRADSFYDGAESVDEDIPHDPDTTAPGVGVDEASEPLLPRPSEATADVADPTNPVGADAATRPHTGKRKAALRAVAALGKRWKRRVSSWLAHPHFRSRKDSGFGTGDGLLRESRWEEVVANAGQEQQGMAGSAEAQQIKSPDLSPRTRAGLAETIRPVSQETVVLGRELGAEEQQLFEQDLGASTVVVGRGAAAMSMETTSGEEDLTQEEKAAMTAQRNLNFAHQAITPVELDVRAGAEQNRQTYSIAVATALWDAYEKGRFSPEEVERRLEANTRNVRAQEKAIESWHQKLQQEESDRKRRFRNAEDKRATSHSEDLTSHRRTAFESETRDFGSDRRRRYSMWNEFANLANVASTGMNGGNLWLL